MEREEIVKVAVKYAKEYNQDPIIVLGVIQAESSFQEKAVSPAGCKGLMQLGPAVCKDYKVQDPFDPRENIDVGCKYLSWLDDCFKMSKALTSDLFTLPVVQPFSRLFFVLAAYNCGIGRTAKIQMRAKERGDDFDCFGCLYKYFPEETRKYVPNVIAAGLWFLTGGER